MDSGNCGDWIVCGLELAGLIACGAAVLLVADLAFFVFYAGRIGAVQEQEREIQ